jgi:short-subunit dehydrogenase
MNMNSEKKPSWALITGASSGIGMELAKLMAAKGHALLLTARSTERLHELALQLKTQYRISVEVFPCDLSVPGSAEQIFLFCREHQMQVQILVNNAGFGDFGLFHELDWEKTRRMIDLNMLSLTHLCRLFIPEMLRQGKGRVMNIASTAAFQPGPTMAVYYATKAYVLHFSEAISNELEGTGVSVTALCPGPTESGFQAAAALDESRLFKGRKHPGSAEVAAFAYSAMMKGKRLAIHGFMNAIMARMVSFTPRALVLKVVRMMQDKVR